MRSLLSKAIDYAGLFEPASLDLETCVRKYALYRSGDDAWALGNLILPVSALAKFEQLRGTADLPVSVVLGGEPERDLEQIGHGARPYQIFECKLPHTDRIGPIMHSLPRGARIFFEVAPGGACTGMLSAIQAAGACAKIRTGGVVQSAIPSSQAVAGFMFECARLRLTLKATAGLHHPLRNQFRLTYQENSPVGTMHGFTNVIFAAAILYSGALEAEACAVLEETRPEAFSFHSDYISWHDRGVTLHQIAETRQSFFAGFGSCSFIEPVEESRALGWIQ